MSWHPAPHEPAAMAAIVALAVLLLVALLSADPLLRTRARRSVRDAVTTSLPY